METCKPLFYEIINLPVEINYGIKATWSRTSHYMIDDLEKRSLIFKAVSKDPQLLKSSCRRDKANIKFISNVTANNVANDLKRISSFIIFC